MEKNTFELPEIQFIEVNETDIICTSEKGTFELPNKGYEEEKW